MGILVILAAAAALAPGEPTRFSDGRPPERFQGNTSVRLEVTDQAGIERACHPLFGAPPAGMQTQACQTGDRVIAPNPCTFPQTETYARLLCHELGHANGWASTHGEEGRAAAPARVSGAATSGQRRKD